MTDDTRKRIPDPPAAARVCSSEIHVNDGTVGAGPGYSGQEYDAGDFAADRVLGASVAAPAPLPVGEDGVMPPENGRRAFIDQKTGAVHGSGSGAGGGNPGEDFASDPAAGDGYPQTGKGARLG